MARGTWLTTLSLLVAGLLCVVLASQGENLGSALTAPCSTAAGCGLPNTLALIDGAGTSDVALWNTYPPGSPSTTGVWVGLIDARSGAAEGRGIRVAGAPAQQGLVGVYNAESKRYLVLWQDGDEISGQLLSDQLHRVGEPFQIAAHDTYVRPGELAADPTGGFLFTEIEKPSGVAARPLHLFATSISPDGEPVHTASWTVTDGLQQVDWTETHAVYVPNARGYLVAWLVFGADASVLADRIVDGTGKVEAKSHAVVRGGLVAGASFALAYQANSATTRVVWIQRSQSGGATRNLVSLSLDPDGAPATPVRSLGQLSPLAAEEPSLFSDLTLAPAAHEEIAIWLQDDVLDTFSLQPHDATAVVTHRTLQGADGSYAHAVATNPTTTSLAVLSTSDHGYLSQLYSSVLHLPN
jgi:hypothetical protein